MTDFSEMEGEGGVMTPATRAQTLLPPVTRSGSVSTSRQEA